MMELRVTQHAGGWVLRLGNTASGGGSFISALRDLYTRVSKSDKPTIEKIGKDKVLHGLLDQLTEKGKK